MIYLDTSALVKLVFEEHETAALGDWLARRADLAMVSSELATVELMRVCRRRDAGAVDVARQLLASIDVVPMTTDVLLHAATVGPPELRSLDAIHLASALSVGDDVTSLIAYDERLRMAAEDAGLAVAAPV
ncbi:MAG: type II toxin-antitoxin system VapC family toxin [Candidatus Dormibacteria bacterium]